MKGINEKFLEELSRTRDPAIFLGVARLLKVKFVEVKDEKPIEREFNEIITDVVEGFCGAPGKRKKELLKLLRDANKSYREEEANGGSSEDSEKAVSDEDVR